MLHYNPRHVSSSTIAHLQEVYCIITASGIVTLCKRPCSKPVESRLCRVCSQLTHCMQFTESDDTRFCNNKTDILKTSMVLLETCRGL